MIICLIRIQTKLVEFSQPFFIVEFVQILLFPDLLEEVFVAEYCLSHGLQKLRYPGLEAEMVMGNDDTCSMSCDQTHEVIINMRL